MDEVQTLRAGDEELVVLPRARYEALLAAAEEAADLRAYDAARAALASGEEELVPDALAKRLIAGENAVRLWREHRGLKAGELAAAAGLSAPYLSQIETGRRRPSVATLERLAGALGVALDDIA